MIATRLWVGDYAARENGKILDFADLPNKLAGRAKREFGDWEFFGQM